MFAIKSYVNINFTQRNLIFVLRHNRCSTYLNAGNKIVTERNMKNNEANNLESLITKYESRLLYNSIIDNSKMKFGYKRNNEIMLNKQRYTEKLRNQLASIQPLPLTLKYISDDNDSVNVERPSEDEPQLISEKMVQFPYKFNKHETVTYDISGGEENINEKPNSIADEISQRNQLYKDTKDWMTAYDNYEDDLVYNEENNNEVNNEFNYGTPNPNSEISNVPCGGCGALLHCKDTGIPGYIPSEIFNNYWKKGAASLQAMICQRCYFLNEYNLALQVSVSPDDYPKILATIAEKRALVVLMVDLMDFPCSIWPGIADILGPKTPIVIVGNKIDLLPRDGRSFMNRIRNNLLNNVKLFGFATSNILHATLISAKTGFGIEDLITSLQSLWKHKGDVYLVGCTNAGKSTLFNTLLQSDYCKVQASDLIQRATISQWPGTTLNMLKFPILRPSGHRLYLRNKRMTRHHHISAEEKRLRMQNIKKHNTVQYATLMDRIDQTFLEAKEVDETKDCFSVAGHANASGKQIMGIDEKDRQYALSRWCFDTPGVVQPDQIIHLLTIEELMDVIPRQLIRPQTFCVKPGTSLFIAGLARLDYLEGPGSVRLTVFRSNQLPVTVCTLEEANQMYGECLGTGLLKVPMQGADRLSKWPGLECSDTFTITGSNPKTSCNDVVLSSAGWVGINCLTDKNYKFQAWTPEKRGIYVRDSLLPEAVTLRGSRIRDSVAYKIHRFI